MSCKHGVVQRVFRGFVVLKVSSLTRFRKIMTRYRGEVMIRVSNDYVFINGNRENFMYDIFSSFATISKKLSTIQQLSV